MTARAGAGSPLEATGSGGAGSKSSAPAGGYAAGSLRSRFVSGTPDRDIVFRRSACSEPTAVIAPLRSGAPRLRNKRLPSGAGAGADEASTGSPAVGASDAAPPDAASEGALTGSGGSASASGLGCGGLGCGGLGCGGLGCGGLGCGGLGCEGPGFAGVGVGDGESVSGRKRWANSSGVTLSPPWSSLSSFTGAHVSRPPLKQAAVRRRRRGSAMSNRQHRCGHGSTANAGHRLTTLKISRCGSHPRNRRLAERWQIDAV